MGSYIGSVVGIKIFNRDVVVVRKGKGPDVSPSPRDEISYFSYASRQRLAFVAANTDVAFRTMITLTYPKVFPTSGKLVKRQLHAFLQWLRRNCDNPLYLWFLEFQQRGAPHIHILIDWSLPTRKLWLGQFRVRVANAWYRLVESGDPLHRRAGTRTERIRLVDGAARYAVKYAFKMRQKRVPKEYRDVGRFWGCSRKVVPEQRAVFRCTEDDIRGVLEGWKYAPSDERMLYKVLYGVADRFLERDERLLDICP